jgi:excisionase family DNA binding protein
MARRSRMLTTTEAARYLGVHPNTIRRWEAQGILPCYRLGSRGDRRFLRDEVDRFLGKSRSDNNGHDDGQGEG